MKQLRKTEWQKGYLIKKNLALCAWVLMLLAGFAGILSHPENIPSLVACVLALAGAGLTLPRLIRYCRKTYHSMPALNRRLTKEEQEELVEHVEIRECLRNNGYIDICSLENIDGLQRMNELIDQLQKKGAEIVLYEDDRVVETEFLKNIIEAHFDSERYLQEKDDKVIEQD